MAKEVIRIPEGHHVVGWHSRNNSYLLPSEVTCTCGLVSTDSINLGRAFELYAIHIANESRREGRGESPAPTAEEGA